MGFLVNVWNYVVGIAPKVLQLVCDLTQGASDLAKVGGGS